MTTPKDEASIDRTRDPEHPDILSNTTHQHQKRGWFRLSLVSIIGWLAITTLIVLTNRRLDWWGYRGPEEGFWIFAMGAFAIFVICNSIPWIAEGFGSQGATNPLRLAGSGQQASGGMPRWWSVIVRLPIILLPVGVLIGGLALDWRVGILLGRLAGTCMDPTVLTLGIVGGLAGGVRCRYLISASIMIVVALTGGFIVHLLAEEGRQKLGLNPSSLPYSFFLSAFAILWISHVVNTFVTTIITGVSGSPAQPSPGK